MRFQVNRFTALFVQVSEYEYEYEYECEYE
jgi:hypothetical protein